jgi:hypothetical protein
LLLGPAEHAQNPRCPSGPEELEIKEQKFHRATWVHRDVLTCSELWFGFFLDTTT